jgi:hypothetical protein
MMPQEGLSAGKRARDIMALLYSSTNRKRELEALLQEAMTVEGRERELKVLPQGPGALTEREQERNGIGPLQEMPQECTPLATALGGNP